MCSSTVKYSAEGPGVKYNFLLISVKYIPVGWVLKYPVLVNLLQEFLFLRLSNLKPDFSINFEVVKHNIPINWKGTNQLWERDAEAKAQKKLIYYDNRNTNDKVYRVAWDRDGCRIAGMKAYMFTPSRRLKRTLAKCLNENGKLIRK